MGRLSGKNALITGGTSGIGLETARQFIAEGANVAITGRRLETAVEQYGSVLALRSDASNVAEQRELARELAHRWGHLDILFVNAADDTHRQFEDWDEAAIDRILQTNLNGPVFLIQALLPILRNPASVILCGSSSAHLGLAQASIYAASKAGLLSLARSLSRELLDRGVRINGLAPGPIKTPGIGKLGEASGDTSLRDLFVDLVPIGRMGSASELANAAVFLASDESSFIVGTEIRVDGGVTNLYSAHAAAPRFTRGISV